MDDPYSAQISRTIPVPVDQPQPQYMATPRPSNTIPVPVANKPDLLNQVLPAVAGAVNGVAFGIPEAIYSGLSGPDQKAAIEQWKADNPEYGVGDIAGSIGSMAIPGGAIAKGLGLGAKALGASKLARGLEDFGQVAAGAPGVKSAVAQAIEQGIPRAGAIAAQTGSGAEAGGDLASNVLLAAPIGKGLATVGKLAKGAEKMSPEITSKILKGTEPIPDGWFVHGRGDNTIPGDSGNMVQMTRDIDIANSYGRSGNGTWMIRPGEKANVADFSSATSQDMDSFMNHLKPYFEKGEPEIDAVIDDIALSRGVPREEITWDDFESELREMFSPKDINNSAGAFDSDTMPQLLDLYGGKWGTWPDMVKTPDGAVMIPGSKNMEMKNLGH